MSSTSDVNANAREFDDLLARARRPRVVVSTPSRMARGNTTIHIREELGLSCIVRSERSTVRNLRQPIR